MKIKNILYLILLLVFYKNNNSSEINQNKLNSFLLLDFKESLHKLCTENKLDLENKSILYLSLKDLLSKNTNIINFKNHLAELVSEFKKKNIDITNNTYITIMYQLINAYYSFYSSNNDSQQKTIFLNSILNTINLITDIKIDQQSKILNIQQFLQSINLPEDYSSKDITKFIEGIYNLNYQLTYTYQKEKHPNQFHISETQNIERQLTELYQSTKKKKHYTLVEKYIVNSQGDWEKFIPEIGPIEYQNIQGPIIYINDLEDLEFSLLLRIPKENNNQTYSIIFPFDSTDLPSKIKVYKKILEDQKKINLLKNNINFFLFNLHEAPKNSHCYSVLREEGYTESNITIYHIGQKKFFLLGPDKSNKIFKNAINLFQYAFDYNQVKPNKENIIYELTKIIQKEIFEAKNIEYIIINPSYIENLFLEILDPSEKKSDIILFKDELIENKNNIRTNIIKQVCYNILQTRFPLEKFYIANQSEQNILEVYGAKKFNYHSYKNNKKCSGIPLNMYIFFVYVLGVPISKQDHPLIHNFINKILNNIGKPHNAEYEQDTINEFITLLKQLSDVNINACISILRKIDFPDNRFFKSLEEQNVLNKKMLETYKQNQKWEDQIATRIENSSELRKIKLNIAQNNKLDEDIQRIEKDIFLITHGNKDKNNVPIQVEITRNPINNPELNIKLDPGFNNIFLNLKDSIEKNGRLKLTDAFTQSDTCSIVLAGDSGVGKTTQAYLFFEFLKEFIKVNYSPTMSDKLIFVNFKGGLKTIYQHTESHATEKLYKVIQLIVKNGYIPIVVCDEITITNANVNDKEKKNNDINAMPEDTFKKFSNNLLELGAIAIFTGNHPTGTADAIQRRIMSIKIRPPDYSPTEKNLIENAKPYWNKYTNQIPQEYSLEKSWHKYSLLKSLYREREKLNKNIFLPDCLKQIQKASKKISEELLKYNMLDINFYMLAQNFVFLSVACESITQKTIEKLKNDNNNNKLPKVPSSEITNNPTNHVIKNKSVIDRIYEFATPLLETCTIPLLKINIPGKILSPGLSYLKEKLTALPNYYSNNEKIIYSFQKNYHKPFIDLSKDEEIENIARIAAATKKKDSLFNYWICTFLETNTSYKDMTQLFLEDHISYDPNNSLILFRKPELIAHNNEEVAKKETLISSPMEGVSKTEKEIWDMLVFAHKKLPIDPKYIMDQISKKSNPDNTTSLVKTHAVLINLNYEYLKALYATSKKLNSFTNEYKIKKMILYTYSPVSVYDEEGYNEIIKKNANYVKNVLYNNINNLVHEKNRERYIFCEKINMFLNLPSWKNEEQFVLSQLTLSTYDTRAQMIDFKKTSALMELLNTMKNSTKEDFKETVMSLLMFPNIKINQSINRVIECKDTKMLKDTNINWNKCIINIINPETPNITNKTKEESIHFMQQSIESEKQTQKFLDLLLRYKDSLNLNAPEMSWFEFITYSKNKCINREKIKSICKEGTEENIIKKICKEINNSEDSDNEDNKDNEDNTKKLKKLQSSTISRSNLEKILRF